MHAKYQLVKSSGHCFHYLFREDMVQTISTAKMKQICYLILRSACFINIRLSHFTFPLLFLLCNPFIFPLLLHPL